MQPVSKQRIGKHMYNRGIIGNGVFCSVRVKVVIKKRSAENRQTSSGVPSEQLGGSWGLQETINPVTSKDYPMKEPANGVLSQS
jgi:hypothetical protein